MGDCEILERLPYSRDHELPEEPFRDIEEAMQGWNRSTRRDVRPRVGTGFIAVAPTSIESEFSKLVGEWRDATRFTSSMTEIVMHPAYQRIIGLGRAAVPLILHDLSKEADYWFWALKAITGEDPVPDGHAARIDKMAEDWLRLGRDRGWVV